MSFYSFCAKTLLCPQLFGCTASDEDYHRVNGARRHIE